MSCQKFWSWCLKFYTYIINDRKIINLNLMEQRLSFLFYRKECDFGNLL